MYSVVMADPISNRKKPGKINKFLEAYISAANESTPGSNEKDVKTHGDVPDVDSVNPKREMISVDRKLASVASIEAEATPRVSSSSEAKQLVVQLPIIEQRKQTQGEPNSFQRNIFNMSSHAPELCATSDTSFDVQREEEATRVAHAVDIDSLDNFDGKEDNFIINQADFDAGSIIANEEERNIQLKDDVSDAPFNDSEEDKFIMNQADFDAGSIIAKEEEHDIQLKNDAMDASLNGREDGSFKLNQANFDAGSIIANEEEHDIQLMDDVLDAPFDDKEEEYGKTPTTTHEHKPPMTPEGKHKTNASSDTISTADISQESNSRNQTPESKKSPGHRTINSRSFSKAKLRFDKRKNAVKSGKVGKKADEPSKEAIDAADNVKDSQIAEEFCGGLHQGGSVVSNGNNSLANGSSLSSYLGAEGERKSVDEKDDNSGFNLISIASEDEDNKFGIYVSQGAEEFCSESFQGSSIVSKGNSSLANRSAYFSFNSGADDDERRSESGHPTSQRNEWKKEAISFDEFSERSDGINFSFYMSTPIKNASDCSDSIADSERVGFYTSSPMNMESFESDAIAGDDNASSKLLDEDDVDHILNEPIKSSQSVVSFHDEKPPASGNIKAAAYSGVEGIDTIKSEKLIPTSVGSQYVKTVDASTTSPLMKKYQLGRSLDVTEKTLMKHQATIDIFSKEEINSISARQIASYLSLEERKAIGTKLLSGKLTRGYTIVVSADDSAVCNTCDMPMLCKNGKDLKSCVVCPVLKKKVLKLILNPEAQSSNNNPVESPVRTARTILLDASKRKSYYDVSDEEPGLVHQEPSYNTTELYVEGRNAVQYARDVISGKIVPGNEAEITAKDNGKTVVPMILFPADDEQSVEVVKNLPPKNPPVMTPASSPSLATPSRNGRPPLARSTPSPARSAKSSSSSASIVASSTVLAIQKQIIDAQCKLQMHAKDSKKQILYSDLLTKLNGALEAVEKLEEITKQ